MTQIRKQHFSVYIRAGRNAFLAKIFRTSNPYTRDPYFMSLWDRGYAQAVKAHDERHPFHPEIAPRYVPATKAPQAPQQPQRQPEQPVTAERKGPAPTPAPAQPVAPAPQRPAQSQSQGPGQQLPKKPYTFKSTIGQRLTRDERRNIRAAAKPDKPSTRPRP